MHCPKSSGEPGRHKVKTFRAAIIRTEKAPDEWPFFSAEFVILATDSRWAERIAEDAIGILEIQRGAYGAMKVDEICELGKGGM